MYRLAIKRRFWFGFSYYSVIGHTTEVIGNTARLVLSLADGGKMAIPRIEKRLVVVYPERGNPQPLE